MTERLLQFIWQFQYFNKAELTTATGDKLQIVSQGLLNTNQGPDFTNAKVKIESTTWAGSVELHIKTSDWHRHNHTGDSNYNNVVLHVVWINDSAAEITIPILELQDKVSKILLQRYEELMNNSSFIPCQNSIATVQDITMKAWKDRLVAERLLRKTKSVELLLQQSNYHWEESFWWMLARNFGMKVNAGVFEAMAKSISINILAKHKNQLNQIEALLFGQAALLNKDFEEDYPVMLQKEYEFLKKKYKLQPVHEPVHFLRMRPGNFPTIRLAQLAALINESSHLFSKIKDEFSLSVIRKWFDVAANDYWHYHYRFDEMTEFKRKKPGASMVDNIVINTVAPVLFAYGNYHSDSKYKLKALQWLEETAGESNSITKGFQESGVENKNACDSQALIELKNEYCNKKRCLDCSVGNYLLKNQSASL